MVSIERELFATRRLVLEFENQGEQAAAVTGEYVRKVLMAPMPTRASDTLPHVDIPWEEARTEGKGGRRSTQEYRELAGTYGFDLPDPMGWMQARDAGRSLEVAQAKVDSEHINIHTEGQWIEELQ